MTVGIIIDSGRVRVTREDGKKVTYHYNDFVSKIGPYLHKNLHRRKCISVSIFFSVLSLHIGVAVLIDQTRLKHYECFDMGQKRSFGFYG